MPQTLDNLMKKLFDHFLQKQTISTVLNFYVNIKIHIKPLKVKRGNCYFLALLESVIIWSLYL